MAGERRVSLGGGLYDVRNQITMDVEKWWEKRQGMIMMVMQRELESLIMPLTDMVHEKVNEYVKKEREGQNGKA